MEARKLATEKVLEITANVKRRMWDLLEQDLLTFLKHYLETIFDQALQEQVGAAPYQRHQQFGGWHASGPQGTKHVFPCLSSSRQD